MITSTPIDVLPLLGIGGPRSKTFCLTYRATQRCYVQFNAPGFRLQVIIPRNLPEKRGQNCRLSAKLTLHPPLHPSYIVGQKNWFTYQQKYNETPALMA